MYVIIIQGCDFFPLKLKGCCKLIFVLSSLGEFCIVFKFHAYSVKKRLFLTTAKLAGGLPHLATTNAGLELRIWKAKAIFKQGTLAKQKGTKAIQ